METIPNQTSSLNLIERLNLWIQESIMVKLLSIGFLLLILLIPGAWIEDLIFERQARADETMAEVASKWSGPQTIAGPVLVIPFKKYDVIDRGKDGVEIHEYIQKAYFLPDKLDIHTVVKPTTLQRGIFDAVVYDAQLEIKSSFEPVNFNTLKIEEKNVMWSDAYVAFGITDLRGISDDPAILVGGKQLAAEPSSSLAVFSTNAGGRNVGSGIISKLGWTGKDSFRGDISINIPLKGSGQLNFVPAGKTTTVFAKGSWDNPSFDGKFLPEDRDITTAGFTANWKVLHFNRPFAQQWVEDEQDLRGAEFGVKLLIPVDQYQKSIRTAKYSALIILLTFVALFMVEITQKVRIHPFQYILIGAALTIYYVLLLSMSEHFGYNIAYIISSVATVLLVSLYSRSFFPSARLTYTFMIILSVFYTFIFVIIQEQDYSLLIGSAGLFLIIGMIMYFSRKVNWYNPSPTHR